MATKWRATATASQLESSGEDAIEERRDALSLEDPPAQPEQEGHADQPLQEEKPAPTS